MIVKIYYTQLPPQAILDMLWDSGLRTTVFNPNHLNVSFGFKFYSIICSGGLGPGLRKADGKFEASSP